MKLKELFAGSNGKKGKEKSGEKKAEGKSSPQESKDATETKDEKKDKPQKDQSREERIKLKKHAMGWPSEVDGTEVDVILEVPEIKVDKIRINVEDIDARVNLHVKAIDFVQINAGVHVHLDKVEVVIKGVRAEAYLQVRLARVKSVLVRVMEMLDNNADMLADVLKPIAQGVGHATGEVGRGTKKTLGGVGAGVNKVTN